MCMKVIKLFRALKTAFVYLFRNFGLSFASIVVMTLSFFIVSIVGLGFYGSLKVIEFVDSQPFLTLFLTGELDEAQTEEVKKIIEKSGNVRQVRVEPIEFSQEEYKKAYPQIPDLVEEGIVTDENKKKAFPILSFVYADTQTDLQTLIDNLSEDKEFLDTFVDKTNIEEAGWYAFNDQQAEAIKEANTILQRMGLIITILLGVISSVLIFITVKLTIQYHARELEIMELVGADWWFIRLPFVIDGMIYGMLGGVISTSIIFFSKNYVTTTSQNIVPTLEGYFANVPWPVLDTELILSIFGVTGLTGAVVGFISSLFAIIRYVNSK